MEKYPVDKWVIDELYQYGTAQCSWPQTDIPEDLLSFLESGSQSVLAIRKDDVFISKQHLLKEHHCWGVVGRSIEQKIALSYLMDKEIPCVSIVGRAGSGKTLLALAAGLQQRKDYLKILVARPAVSLGNTHQLGFIPGGMDEKLAPWTMPIFDNIEVLKTTGDRETIQKMLQEKKIEMCPLQYIRGRSLYRCFVIIDEAQNLTPDEIKAVGTRIGEGSKIVFTGDTDQVDKKYLKDGKDGMTHLIYKTNGHRLCASIKLKRGERSPLADLLADVL